MSWAASPAVQPEVLNASASKSGGGKGGGAKGDGGSGGDGDDGGETGGGGEGGGAWYAHGQNRWYAAETVRVQNTSAGDDEDDTKQRL